MEIERKGCFYHLLQNQQETKILDSIIEIVETQKGLIIRNMIVKTV